MKIKKFKREDTIIDPIYEPINMSSDAGLYEELCGLYYDLLKSFELRRASWLNQSGLLFEVYPGCTHTRRAHAIGCWCVGWFSLFDIEVIVRNKGEPSDRRITLREWLESKDGKYGKPILKEYMSALMLHDIGHPPFSHALEFNPFLSIDHGEIAVSLLSGGHDPRRKYWLQTLKYILGRRRTIDFPVDDMWPQSWSKAKKAILTARETLINHRVDCKVVSELLRPSTTLNERIYGLHKLIDSEVDIDRIDHFLRDSYFSGVKFADYKVRSLLQSLVVVTRDTQWYNKSIATKNQKEPAHLIVKDEGIEQVKYLLTARELIFRKVLWHPENLRLIGALNQGVRSVISQNPLLLEILPFLTDQMLLHIFRSEDFSRTTAEGYGRVLSGEIPAESHPFYTVQRVNDQEYIKAMFEKAEQINSLTPLDPALIVFSSYKRKKEDGGWGNIIVEGEGKPLKKTENDGSLAKWVSTQNEIRRNQLFVWGSGENYLKQFFKVLQNE